jgi:cystathionine gamma-synthase
MGAASAAFRLFPPNPTVVAPEVAYMAVRESLDLEHAAGRARFRFVDITDTQAVTAACTGADVLWLESPTNPLLGIADLPELCAHARANGILVVVDNTLATPLGQRPLALGADVVVHSGTKAMGGHSDLLIGVAVARTEELGAELHEARHLAGTTPGALEVFLCLRGLRTLPLRLERSQRNAGVLAERLSGHAEVHEVRYPGLASHPQHDLAERTLDGPGFMLTFRVHGGADRADALVRALRVLTHATSFGGVESLIERRARYPAERHIPADLLRLSVGCEHVEDLWRDLDQALAVTSGSRREP